MGANDGEGGIGYVLDVFEADGYSDELLGPARAELAALREDNAKLIEALALMQHEFSLYALEDHSSEAAERRMAARVCARDALSVSKDAERYAGCPVSPRGAWLSMEQLREIEWQQNDQSVEEPDSCAACKRYKDRGHAPDCWLARAIQSAESNPRERTNDAQDVVERKTAIGYGALCSFIACPDNVRGMGCHGPAVCPLGRKEAS